MNELGEKLWIAVHEGKPKRLIKFLDEIRNDRSFTAIINFRCDLYDEDGGNLITHCVKQGRDKGSGFGKDFWALIAILVENGADVNAVDKANRTPLFWACKLKYTNTVTKLLKLGADPFIRDQDDCNSFHISVRLGHKDITSLLLDHDEKLLGVHGSHGVPPLVSAVKYNQFETCSLLLERGADVNSLEQRTKRSSVYHAIRNRNLEILDLLLKYEPEVDGLDTENRSILYLVSACSDSRFFQRIHAYCPKFSNQIMDTPADEGKTPVIVACQNGNAEQLKHLLEEGASTSAVDVYRKTALHYCADNLETQCAEMLLAKDPSIMDAKDEQGYTALALSVLVGNINLIKLLLEKGADIETRDEEGHKLAHWAAVCGHLKVLDILIQHKADMESKDTHHAYPIHYAAQMNCQNSGISDPKISEKVLKKVLDCKVRLTVVDDAGRQPLLWAACAGNAESCRLLLKAGADINSVDNDDLTALHCAASRGHHQCIEALRKHGAELNKMDKNRCTPLFYAITLGNKECTKALIDAKADVNHVDGRGRNPAHCAAIKGCLDTLKMLEKEKCDMWKQNNKGDYPVHEAAQTGHLDVVKYLLRQRNDQDAVNVINSAGKTLLHIGAATNNLPLCKLLMNYDACNKNALMKHAGKEFTPYDLAVIKRYEETAEYLKTKGALPHADASNVDKDKDKANTKKEKESKEVKRPRSVKATDAEKKIAIVKTAKKQKKDKPKNAESQKPEEKENNPPSTVESSKEEEKDSKSVEPVVAPVVKKTPERKVSKARKPSNDEDKADPINTSQTSLQTREPALANDSVTQNNTINEEERIPSPMGQSSSKKPEPAGKFVTLEKYEETKPEPESKQKKPSKRGKVGFNTSISDNEDSGNETDHSRSRIKRSAIVRKQQHGVTKKAYVNHVKDSVRTYNRKRETSRSLQQLRRAQIHSGPMHDIVMFSKMMDHYRQGIGPEEADMDVRQYANWDGYLNDQLRFVSHLYNDEAHTPRDLQETAKEQHKMLETEANAIKSDADKRCELIQENEDRQVKRNKEMDREIDQLASRTAEMFDSVHHGASTSLNSAKSRNQKLRDEIRKAREEKLQETDDPLERTVLQRQEMEDRLADQQEEIDSARRMHHKGWHRRKDEEMRQRLLLAYRPCFPNDVFSNKSVCVSGGRVQSAGRSLRVDSAMTPRPRRTQPSPRPGSHKSADSSVYSSVQSRVKSENVQVQMTPYGLRRVRNQERPTYANWSRKYDGSIRPRTGLVFVEPRVYGDLLREEKEAKQRVSNSVRHQYTNGEHNSVHSNENSDSPLP